MWCNNNAQQVSKIPIDTLNALPKLRPIMPRPFSTQTPLFFPQNNIISGKREMISTVPFVSTRWNPTREQLQALEEMYRDGIRTPSAQQIQQIASKLRRFGKIEGKNVFYWFQNHKAREKQKKRRQMESNIEKPAKRSQSGLSRTYLETKQSKKLPTPSSCSTASECSASMVQECKQEDCKELQEQNLTAKRIETWWPLGLSFCMPLNSNNNKVTELNQENDQNNNNKSGIIKENKTLQLFPIATNGYDYTDEEENYDVSNVGPAFVPTTNKFFEFLPIKY
ncbi:hypothetical protein CASFOL_020524 [Castilleja foliolosa]|uniref:Homeobox domain-containing protein n=1 Tax=Castilleja foliolosa TaxID=1961234 RepID=A0ABD3D2L1_9LAMI